MAAYDGLTNFLTLATPLFSQLFIVSSEFLCLIRLEVGGGGWLNE